MVDLSGPGREEGEEVREAARLALREAVRAGRAPAGVELLILDDGGDPRRAARLGRSLERVLEVVAVVGPSARETVADLLNVTAHGRGGLPTLVPLPLPGSIAPDREWVFGLGPSRGYLGETLAWFLVTELRADSAVTFSSPDPYGSSLEEGFARELLRLGGGTLERVRVEEGRQEALPIDVGTAPAVLVSAPGAPARRIVDELRRAGVEAPILTDEGLTAAGAVYRPLLFDPAGAPAARAFAARFGASFGHPPGPAAALAYDATRLVLEGLRAGARARPALRDWLAGAGRGAPHEGVTGRFFFTREHDAVREVGVASVRTGTAVIRRPPAPSRRAESRASWRGRRLPRGCGNAGDRPCVGQEGAHKKTQIRTRHA